MTGGEGKMSGDETSRSIITNNTNDDVAKLEAIVDQIDSSSNNNSHGNASSNIATTITHENGDMADSLSSSVTNPEGDNVHTEGSGGGCPFIHKAPSGQNVTASEIIENQIRTATASHQQPQTSNTGGCPVIHKYSGQSSSSIQNATQVIKNQIREAASLGGATSPPMGDGCPVIHRASNLTTATNNNENPSNSSSTKKRAHHHQQQQPFANNSYNYNGDNNNISNGSGTSTTATTSAETLSSLPSREEISTATRATSPPISTPYNATTNNGPLLKKQKKYESATTTTTMTSAATLNTSNVSSGERLRMEAMINSAVDPIVQINDTGIIQLVNPATCRVFKYTEEEMIGQNVKMLMPEVHGLKHDEYLHHYVKTGESKIMGRGRQLRGRKSDGSTFAMFLSLSEARITEEEEVKHGNSITNNTNNGDGSEPTKRRSTTIFTGIIRDLSGEEEMRMRMEAMIESAVDPIVQIDQAGLIQMVNPACCSVFKYLRDEMIGQNVTMLMPPEHAYNHDEYLKHYLQTGEKRIMGTGRRLKGMKSDGSIFSMLLSVSEASVGESKIFTGIIRDLSAEEDVQAKMEAMIDSAVDPIVQIDSKGLIQMVNPACCSTFRYEREEMVGQNVKMLMPESHASKHDDYLYHYMKTGEKKVMGTGRKLKGRKSDGSTFHMFLSLSEAKVGEQVIFTGIIRDMSAESEERQKMEAMINSAVDPIVQISPDGTMQMVNPACCQVFRYDEDQMLGKNVKMLMPDTHASKHDEYLHNYLKTGVKKVMGTGRQLRGKKSDGKTFPMFLSLSEALIGEKRIFTGIIRDLSVHSSHSLYRSMAHRSKPI